MKYWVLLISLFILGCGGGESGGSDAAATAEDVAAEAEEAAEETEEVQVLASRTLLPVL